MNDVCFCNPPHPDLISPFAQAPLGILYLAAVCEKAGLYPTVCNLAGATREPSSWRIPQARAYAITGTFLDVEAVNTLAKEIKRREPKSHIFVGGPIHLSSPLLCDEIDLVVKVEGEPCIVDLVLGRHVEWKPESVAPIQDLDSLPFPARHLWSGPLGGNIFLKNKNYFGNGSTTILSSRGCPMSCAFCAGPALRPVGLPVRFRNPTSVVEEMELCVREFGIRQFRFSDEFLTCKQDHILGLCAAIMSSSTLEYGDGCAWRASVGVNPCDVDLFKTMRAAGCRELAFGIESADPVVLETLNKKQTPQACLTALENARKAGLRTRALLMVGCPGETERTLLRNLTFLRTAPFDQVALTVFTPIPGCDIAKHPDKYGCKILTEARSLCLYGKAGRNPLTPAIEVESLSLEEHTRHIEATVHAAEHTGKLGMG